MTDNPPNNVSKMTLEIAGNQFNIETGEKYSGLIYGDCKSAYTEPPIPELIKVDLTYTDGRESASFCMDTGTFIHMIRSYINANYGNHNSPDPTKKFEV